jgi:hypothetical protein
MVRRVYHKGIGGTIKGHLLDACMNMPKNSQKRADGDNV